MVAYFRDANQHIPNRWYSGLRSAVIVVGGFLLLVAPVFVIESLTILFALSLLLDGVLLLVELITYSPHLWKIAGAKAAAEVAFAGVLLLRDSLGIDLLILIIGLLLILRSILELISFSESYARVNHQRLIFISAAFSLILGVLVFIGIFRDLNYLVMVIGFFMIFQGLLRIANLNQRMQQSQQETHRSDRSITFLHIDPSKYKKLLVLTPHPDDLEGFTGGLVYRVREFADVTSVIFAGGDLGVWQKKYEKMPHDDYIRVRLEESEQAGKILDVDEIIYMGYHDRQVQCNEESINRALQQIELHQPDLIVSFEFYRRATPYPHPDHLATGEIACHAIARYEKSDELDFFVTSTLLPNCFIDVSRVRRVKLEALACHTTQAGLNAIIFPLFEKLITRIWGILVGVQYAEGYRQVDIQALKQRLGKG